MNPEFKRSHGGRTIQVPARACGNVLEFGLCAWDDATRNTNISELRKPIPIGTVRAEHGVGQPSCEQIVLAFHEACCVELIFVAEYYTLLVKFEWLLIQCQRA